MVAYTKIMVVTLLVLFGLSACSQSESTVVSSPSEVVVSEIATTEPESTESPTAVPTQTSTSTFTPQPTETPAPTNTPTPEPSPTPDLELIEVSNAQAAGFTNVVAIQYDEATGGAFGFDAEGNLVAELEAEGAEWQAAVQVPEWLFGPEEKVPSLLEGITEMPQNVIIHDQANKSWEVVPFGSARMNQMNPHGVRILTPDEFYQMQKPYINGAMTTAYIADVKDRIGTNNVIGEITAFVPLDAYSYYISRHDYTFYGMVGYTYTRDSDGNLVLLIAGGPLQSDEGHNLDYRHYANSPDAPLQRRTTLPTAWGPTVEEFVERLTDDPDNPEMVLLFGTNTGVYYSGEGEAPRIFDGAARGAGGFDLSEITYTELGKYRFSGPIAFSGIMLTKPLGE